jgi:hypothetical protein
MTLVAWDFLSWTMCILVKDPCCICTDSTHVWLLVFEFWTEQCAHEPVGKQATKVLRHSDPSLAFWCMYIGTRTFWCIGSPMTCPNMWFFCCACWGGKPVIVWVNWDFGMGIITERWDVCCPFLACVYLHTMCLWVWIYNRIVQLSIQLTCSCEIMNGKHIKGLCMVLQDCVFIVQLINHKQCAIFWCKYLLISCLFFYLVIYISCHFQLAYSLM